MGIETPQRHNARSQRGIETPQRCDARSRQVIEAPQRHKARSQWVIEGPQRCKASSQWVIGGPQWYKARSRQVVEASKGYKARSAKFQKQCFWRIAGSQSLKNDVFGVLRDRKASKTMFLAFCGVAKPRIPCFLLYIPKPYIFEYGFFVRFTFLIQSRSRHAVPLYE